MASKVSGYIGKMNPGDGIQYSLGSTAYGYCETAAGTVAKTVDMTGFTLIEGATVFIKFKNSNSAESPTLNVNSTGAKPIVQYGTTAVGTSVATSGWKAGAILCLTYDGTSWVRDQGYNKSDMELNNVTNHQQVHEVAWDSTNKKITRSKNGTAGDVVQFVAGDNITLTAAAGKLTIANSYSLPTAAGSTLGGIKTGYSASGKNYAIKVDSNGNAYVNVPWTDTNKYHKTGSWSGLTYTATAVNSADELKFTIPTGTTSTTVAVGNHTHTTSLATDTGTSSITLTHGGKYKLTAGGTSVIFTLPSDNNTDTLVKQTAKTDNVNYKILTTTSASPTSGSAAEAGYGANLTYNPSLNKLQTGNLALTGEIDVTGNATFHNETFADSLTAGNLIINGNTVLNNEVAIRNKLTLGTNGVYNISADGSEYSGNAATATKATKDASGNTITTTYAPLASPIFSGTPKAPTAAAGTNTTQIATTAFVTSAVSAGFAVNDAMIFKGTIAGGTTGNYGALTPAAERGHTYKVSANGAINGQWVEIGDILICTTDSTAASTSSNYSTIKNNWVIVQTNVDGAVYMGHAGSAIGGVRQPVYVASNGAATAGEITFGTLNANRLMWTNAEDQPYAGYHYANDTKIAVHSNTEPDQNFYVSGTAQFNIGSADGANRKNVTIYGSNRFLSLGGAAVQAYKSDDTASTLYLNYYGGATQIGYSTEGYQSNLTVYGNITPGTTNLYNIGSTSKKWNNGYFRNLYISDNENYTASTSVANGITLSGIGGWIDLTSPDTETTPHIDFKLNKSSLDYQTRIESNSPGRITIKRDTTNVTSSKTVPNKATSFTYNNRSVDPIFEVDGAAYIKSALNTGTYIVNNSASGGDNTGYYLFENNVSAGRLYVGTKGTAAVSDGADPPTYSNTTGITILYLGNSLEGRNGNSASAEDNSVGRLRLYGESTRFHDIRPSTTVRHQASYLPQYYTGTSSNSSTYYYGRLAAIYSGTAAGEDTFSDVGSLTQPVYVTQYGIIKPTSYSLDATIEAGTTNYIAYYSGTHSITKTKNAHFNWSDLDGTTKGYEELVLGDKTNRYGRIALYSHANASGGAYIVANNPTSWVNHVLPDTAGWIVTGGDGSTTGVGSADQIVYLSTSGVLTAGTSATNANTASTIVKRDASGNFNAGTITATLAGNASTATEFSATTTVALTGDATGASAASKKGWSVPVTLANSGVTAGSYGPSANAEPGYGATFNVPYITVDAKGRITSASTKTIKIPASDEQDHRDPGYGKITPAGDTGTSAVTANTTQITAGTYNEAFTFKTGNKWLTIAGTNSSTNGSDVLTIGHKAGLTAKSSYGSTATTASANSGTIKVTDVQYDEAGHITASTDRTITLSQVKNTAGSTDTSSKIFLIGATEQSANPQTYSDNQVYTTSGVLTAKEIVLSQTGARSITFSRTDGYNYIQTPASGGVAICATDGSVLLASSTLLVNATDAKPGKTDTYDLGTSSNKWKTVYATTLNSSDTIVNNLTASQAVSTDANKKLVSTNLTVSDPTASGTGITYIATISQSAVGKITATKSTVRSASTSQTGVLQFTTANTNTQLATLPTTWTATPTDNTYFIRGNANGTTNDFGLVKFSTLWSYVNGKITDGIYWANEKATSAAAYDKEPEVKSLTIGNGTTASGTKKVQFVYDATTEVLNFVFT